MPRSFRVEVRPPDRAVRPGVLASAVRAVEPAFAVQLPVPRAAAMTDDRIATSDSCRAQRLLRWGAALLIGAHAYSRIYKGTLPDFGQYLDSEGLPMGLMLAWAVTATEVAFTLCMLSGRFLRVAILCDSCILLCGIVMVHLPNGWFVVGGGRNGVEYSVSLLLILAAIWTLTPQPTAGVSPSSSERTRAQ